MNWFYRAARGLGRFCFNVFGRIEINGRENVPPYGPLIVVANHISYNDPPALAVAVPRILCSLGKIELFSNPVKRAFMRGARVYPVDRSAGGLEAIRTALDLLARDQALVIFPEGRISPHHAMQEAKAGAAYLAIKSQAPILPVGCRAEGGLEQWMRNPDNGHVATEVDVHSHYFAGRSQVVELVAVSPPPGLPASVGRDRKLPS